MLYHLFSSCVPCCRTIFMKLYQIVKWILPVRIWNIWLGITHAKILAMPLPILLRSVYVHPTIFTRRDKYVSLLVCGVKQRKRVTGDLGHTRSEKQGVSFSFIILLRLGKVVNCFGHMTWCRMKKNPNGRGEASVTRVLSLYCCLTWLGASSWNGNGTSWWWWD